MRKLLLALIVVCSLQTALSAQILALCVVPSPSHSLWCYKYVAALADKGHQITVLATEKPKIQLKNVTTFIGYEVMELFKAQDQEELSDATESPKIEILNLVLKSYDEMSTKAVLRTKAVEDLLNHCKNNKKPFDLIIQDNAIVESVLGLVPLCGNPPLILVTAWGAPQWMLTRVGNIMNPAYIPNMISDFQQQMSIFERLQNTFYYIYTESFYNFVTVPFQDKMMRERFGDHLPSVKDIAKRANLIFVTNHFALDGPKPFLPGVIPLTGLHITEPKPLPQEIKEFMDGAQDGVVVLSFGTNVGSAWLPQDFERQVVGALRQLPQRVLWKWDKDVDNLPPNVRVSRWLPQADIMVHPKMRLFITHCGLASTYEALFHKVPVLAVPVFFDQNAIAKDLVRRNITIKLNVFKLISKDLLEGIREILTKPMYKRNTEKLGELVRDTPLTARQTAIYWTEYVLRHDGAPHLRSAAADMPWYQLLLLDVLSVVCLTILFFMWTLKTIMVFLGRRIFPIWSKIKSD